MTQGFYELLLSELHMATYEPGLRERGSDQRLCEALTANENLASLGYTLRPEDIVRLSVSDSLYGFFEQIRALVPDVKAEPMYPGFPQQVMEMTEAEFRMHQMLHYFSTYGIENLTGLPVSQGWLPETGGCPRREHDETLLAGQVIELIPEQEAPRAVLEALLQRRERLTIPELALVLESAQHCTPEQLRGLKVRFKENLDLLFPKLMREGDRQTAFETLKEICAHAGDVLRCGEKYLRGRHYHLKTREKKLLVRLLEAYPVRNLKENLMLSCKARERNLLLLQYLDYNRFSKSAEHREAVRALRNGELLSWQGIGEKLLKERKPEALQYFAGRPGYLVRMMNRLLTLGYAEDAILSVLTPAAKMLSGHLIVKTIRQLGKGKAGMIRNHQTEIRECRAKFDLERIAPRFDLSSVHLAASEKQRAVQKKWFDDPAREIQESVFEPLNAMIERLTGTKRKLTESRSLLTSVITMKQNSGSLLLIRNGSQTWNSDMVARFLTLESEKTPAAKIERLNTEIALLEKDIREQEEMISQTRSECQRDYERLAKEMRERNTPAYMAELEVCRDFERTEIRKAIERYDREAAAHRKAMETLPAREAAALERLEKRYQERLLKSYHPEEAARILKAVLKAHFSQAVTPLRGKKVFLDMEEFDLEHSELETEDRSKDGGYIRSGICFKIPENAKIVRFFVYWDDQSRTDIDLHASGQTTEGQPLHIGWNADFRNGGVVHSGDITHSNAAEYIDIDLTAPIREIYANVSLFSGKESFRKLETCYVGLMAVKNAGQHVKLYDRKNCFFTHNLTQNTTYVQYGCIDVQNRFVRFIGQPDAWDAWRSPEVEADAPAFTLKDYLNCLLEAQQTVPVSDRAEADLVLTMGKSAQENSLSLIDHNFFLES